MKKLAFALVFLSGCTHMVPVEFDVETDPPGAVVESDGVTLCESTPCTVELKCRKRIITGSAKGNPTEITVTPKGGSRIPASQQSKIVDACKAANGKQKLYFNMTMDKVMPVQRIDIKHRNE